MNGISFIRYMGFNILHVDISNGIVSSSEMIDIYKRLYIFLKKYRKEEKILILHNVGSTLLTKEWGTYWIPKMNEFSNKIEKRAIVYSSLEQLEFVNLLLSKITNESKILGTYTEAMNWLIYGEK